MKNYIYLLIFSVYLLITSCSPKVTTSIIKKYDPTDFKTEVVVLGVDDQIPTDAEVLGDLKIGDSGFTSKCTYEEVITQAKMEAMKVGGNVLKITEHKLPTAMGSACHRITAKILKISDTSKLSISTDEEIIPNADYAVLNIYRYSGVGSLVGYDIYLGDQIIGRVVNNYKTNIKVTKFGLNTVWAKTEAKAEVPIDIERGHQYYIRCSVGMGVFVGHPKLQLVDSKNGKSEFESFKAKHQ